MLFLGLIFFVVTLFLQEMFFTEKQIDTNPFS